MSLYHDLFVNPDKALYYNNGALRSSLLRSKKEPNDYNRSILRQAIQKEFVLDSKEKYLEKVKPLHTASLYLLRCYLSDLIDDNLKEYFSKLIGALDDWYDFKYTWLLTTFYYDTGCAIES